ncbi:MAG: HypC/HybG/HupF family hydrogenase formation chaperone [Thermosynechococcaceae cyanobacterium MS004]|nr:HypC/HybG/HupF family hydrogenase formation chaperone [Thermosynechococcaceae cyanobacterium MS004]
MCLAVPGQIISIAEPLPDQENDTLFRTGKVSFGGIVKDVSLAYVPEATVGNYVIVHVGFALSVLDEDEAQKTLQDLNQLEVLAP